MQLPNIQIGDGLLGDALLASVEVVQALNQHWWCTVECRQSSDEPVPVERFLGQTIEVRTFDEDGAAHVHFTGFILKVELLTEVWGSYAARLLAVSSSYKLDLAARKQYYAEHTLAAVAAKACGYAGLAAQVQAPAQKPLNYVQYGETDFAFLHRIVDDYGCWMRPGAGGLEIFNAFQLGSTVGWRGKDETDGLIGFKVRSRLSPTSYSGSHYDHHAMASETYESVAKPAEFYPSVASTVGAVQSISASALPSGFEPQRARAMTLDEYRQQLEAEAERSLGASVIGTGESRSQLLKAGDTVEIEGALEPGGVYGLTRVEHRWRPEGYSNTFECTPWKQYRNPQPPAQRDWQGVVAARVVEHNDPKKMGRLRVQFFWQTEGATHWARMVSPHAGPDRGLMFMPEVGDEVAVAFEDGDPERPILLGSLWNGVQQAPRGEFFGSDIPANDIKRIVTKSGNRLQMVDTPGRETVVVATPNHTSMAMTEKSDATGRELVALHSDGDIVLSAPAGRVHVQSKYFSREVGEASTAAAATSQPTFVQAAYYPPVTPIPVVAPKPLKDSEYDGCLIGKGCEPLTKKQQPGQHLSDAEVKSAWSSAYSSNSKCCQARRAAGQAPKRIVYVNGIRTDKAGQCVTLQRIANQSCAEVLGIHNATDGAWDDLLQSRSDKNLIDKARAGKPFSVHDGRNPAVDSMSDVIYNSVLDNNPPEVWAHSQGGAIASLASYDANNQLKKGGSSSGITGVQVNSFGSAAQSWPSTMSGQHFINIQDLTPVETGLGDDPSWDADHTGPNQKVIRFEGAPGAADPKILDSTQLQQLNKMTTYFGDPPTTVSNLPPEGVTQYHDVNTTYLNAAHKVNGGCSPDGS